MVKPGDSQGNTAIEVRAARARFFEDTKSLSSGTLAANNLASWFDGLVGRAAEQAGLFVAGDCALVATGGWGRREMAPHSDIDLLVLVASGKQGVIAKRLEAFLYPIWDAGISVGHAVRDCKEVVSLAKQDFASHTAFLDARFLAGARPLFDSFVRSLRTLQKKRFVQSFVHSVLSAKDQRRRRYGSTLYLLEPNLKHGAGGLRDLASIGWLVRVAWPGESPPTLHSVGVGSEREREQLERARSHLLGLRGLLHLAAGTAKDQLTFENQETIAANLFPDATTERRTRVRSALAAPVEVLMQDYYQQARCIAQSLDRTLDDLFDRYGSRSVVVSPVPAEVTGVVTVAGKVSFDREVDLQRDPGSIWLLLQASVELSMPVSGVALSQIENYVHAESQSEALGFFMEPISIASFVELLVHPKDTGEPAVLEVVNQTGILGMLIPEFSLCYCRVQHDLYHAYTVDQHQLYAVRMAKELFRGLLSVDYPLPTQVAQSLPDYRTLSLACLLHDVGKPLGKGHAEKGSHVVRRAAAFLGYSEEEIERSGFLVRRHLAMTHVSQRRDLSDAAVIQRFAGRVGSVRNLDELFVLSVCDAAMTAPGNLSAWKYHLLQELYLQTGRALRGESLRVASVAPEGLDPSFVAATNPSQLTRHMALLSDFEETDSPTVFFVKRDTTTGLTELSLVAEDKPGLLAGLAGVFSINQITVVGAVLGSRKHVPGAQNVVMNLFFLRSEHGDAIAPEDSRWQGLQEDLNRLFTDKKIPDMSEEIAHKRPVSILEQRVTPGAITEVRCQRAESANATIVEVATQDRPGVLYSIASVFRDRNFDVRLAKIATEGERASDSFYVVNTNGKALSDTQASRLARALTETLESVL